MSRKVVKIGWFTVPEWEKEQKWLRKQHNNGLKLINATLPCFYTFEKCTQEDVVYQLDFNKDGLENRADYIQMFRDCGWEYVTEMAGYSYFRKAVSEMKGEGEEKIFSDDASRLDMMKRVFRGRIVGLIIIFFCIIIPQLIMQFHNGSDFGMALFWIFVVLFVMYVTAFVSFAVMYLKVKNRLER